MNSKFSRRTFIKTLACVGGAAASSITSSSLLAQSAYSGKLLLNIQLDGGVDVTSFCDPKTNIGGEQEINRWARVGEPLQAGNLTYAPYANNASFFDKHFDKILAINGVDSQTNSHTVGVVHSWSGRNAEGYPTITALMAANVAPELPLANLNFGGFSNTEGIIRNTRVDNVEQLRNIIFPNSYLSRSDSRFRSENDWDRIRILQIQNLQRMSQQLGMLEGDKKDIQYYLEAFTRAEGIQEFGNLIPDQNDIQQVRSLGSGLYSSLQQQAQVALLAFKSGVSVSADLFEGGFDTHKDHDDRHPKLLGNATDAIDYVWSYAEELGLADRLIVLVGSDFGRTPYFNAVQGKDHWPIGSYMIMEKNVGYTNRVIGETDEGHNAFKISPTTMTRDDSNGTIIYPKHVHKALRRYLGIESSAITELFPFNNTEDFDFFGQESVQIGLQKEL